MGEGRIKALILLCVVAICLQAVDAQRRLKPRPGPGPGPGAGAGLPFLRPPQGMSDGFYNKTCPQAESIIRAAVTKGYNADNSITAGLIRMFFHDCFVRGCDASVLLDNANSEKLGAPNANSLRGFEVLNEAKANLEAQCPGVVSCADVIAYAARDSMEIAGSFKVSPWYGGRRDGSTSISSDTLTELPAPFSNFSTLQTSFEKKGLNQADMVILSGAHTIGQAHCGIILSRLYNFKGTGATDPALNPTYANQLKQLCPSNAPGNKINMEMMTPTIIDSKYFDDVDSGKGLFVSDNALRTTPVGQGLVKVYRVPQVFTPAFVLSMRKMGNIGVLTGNQGNIRKVCNSVS